MSPVLELCFSILWLLHVHHTDHIMASICTKKDYFFYQPHHDCYPCSLCEGDASHVVTECIERWRLPESKACFPSRPVTGSVSEHPVWLPAVVIVASILIILLLTALVIIITVYKCKSKNIRRQQTSTNDEEKGLTKDQDNVCTAHSGLTSDQEFECSSLSSPDNTPASSHRVPGRISVQMMFPLVDLSQPLSCLSINVRHWLNTRLETIGYPWKLVAEYLGLQPEDIEHIAAAKEHPRPFEYVIKTVSCRRPDMTLEQLFEGLLEHDQEVVAEELAKQLKN